jgi:hypothetical protein
MRAKAPGRSNNGFVQRPYFRRPDTNEAMDCSCSFQNTQPCACTTTKTACEMWINRKTGEFHPAAHDPPGHARYLFSNLILGGPLPQEGFPLGRSLKQRERPFLYDSKRAGGYLEKVCAACEAGDKRRNPCCVKRARWTRDRDGLISVRVCIVCDKCSRGAQTAYRSAFSLYSAVLALAHIVQRRAGIKCSPAGSTVKINSLERE